MINLRYPFETEHIITQHFGITPWSDQYAKYGLKGHNGIDFLCNVGTPILTCDEGEVVKAELSGGYGLCVKIHHAHGDTLYGHCSRCLVNKGDKVKAGQQVAYSGGQVGEPNAGNSTGAHMHLEYRPLGESTSNGYAGAVDPEPLLVQSNVTNEPILAIAEVITDSLNARSGPGTTYKVLNTYEKGAKLRVVEIQPGWVRVQAYMEKWVSDRYITYIQEPVSSVETAKTPSLEDHEKRIATLEKMLGITK